MTTMVDKISIVIIAFVVVFALSAGLMATGTVPQIFNTGSIANDTKYESINQTDILNKFVTLYLANTKNDTREALQALASARESIVNQEESLENQEQLIQENRRTLVNQEKILNENRNITQDIFEISEEHMEQQKYHDAQQKIGDDLVSKIDNVTTLSYELLAGHAKNVTQAQVETDREEAINQSGR